MRIVDLIGAFLFLLVVGFVSFRWALEGAIHHRREVVVPAVEGKSTASAVEILSRAGLSVLRSAAETNDEVPIGAVLRQKPPAGSKVREGKTVKIVVSQGGETVFVPNLSGLKERNAVLLLRQQQLVLGEIEKAPSLQVEKGVVLGQNPPADSSVEKGAVVGIIVSAGAPPEGIILMPEFRQAKLDEALEWSRKFSLPVEVQRDRESLFPNGTVLAQDPAPDTRLAAESKIVIVASGRPGNSAGKKKLRYQVAQGEGEQNVRIVVLDRYGEREVFNGLRAPGSRIALDIPQTGPARARVFVNGVLVQETNI